MLSEISQSQKIQRPNVFSEKWMMIYNGGGSGEWENNGETVEYVEGNEREGVWEMVEWDIITLCICMITQMVWICIVYNHRNKTMCTMNQNAVCKKLKAK